MRISAQEAGLQVDRDACTRCGLCTHICWTHAMVKGEGGFPVMAQNAPEDTWHSCWACQRCMAVCPTGALSICGKDPSDSVPISALPTPEAVEALMLNRRTCRDFEPADMPNEVIEHILRIVGNAPSAGCHQQVRFSVISSRETLARVRDALWTQLCENADRGIYPGGDEAFAKQDFLLVKKGMDRGKDVIFRNAPHVLFLHAPMQPGNPTVDTAIAMSYAELLFNAHGYGTVVASFAGAALRSLPGFREKLGIPSDHFLQCPLLFGAPAIRFPRGVQRFDHLHLQQIRY